MNNISITTERGGIRIRAYAPITTAELYRELETLGFVMTSAEKENLALFSCDEILRDPLGNMFFHPDYQIRMLADSLMQARERELESEWLYEEDKGVFLPIIEMEEQ
jgi:hypothetical protein